MPNLRSLPHILAVTILLWTAFSPSQAQAAEVLSNGGFDAGACGATEATDWTYNKGSGAGNVRGNGTSQAGDCAGRYNGTENGGGNGYVETPFTYDQNDTISDADITYYYRGNDGWDSCTQTVILIDPSSTQHQVDSRNCRTAGSYTQVNLTNATIISALEAYNGAGTAWNLRVNWQMTDNDPGRAWIDTIAFDITAAPSDTTAPSSSISDPTGGQVLSGTSYTIQGSASDAGSGVDFVEVSVDGGSNWFTATGTTSWSYVWSLTQDISTSFTIQSRATDVATNVETPSAGTSVTVDTLAPTTTLTTSPASPDGTNGWFFTTPDVTLSSNEAGTSQYQWGTTTGAWTNYSAAFAAIGGTNTLYYRSIDTPGNTEDAKSQVIKVDTTDPTASVTDPTAGQYINGVNYTVQGTAADTNSGVAAVDVFVNGSEDGTATGTTSWSYTWTLPADGFYQLQAGATDDAGNIGALSSSVGVTVDNTAPTVQSVTPTNGAIEQVVTVDATATFSEGMSADTISGSTFTMTSSTGDPVAGTVSYDAPSLTATLNPTGNLLYEETYTVTVDVGVTDIAGNPLASPNVWTFTTKSLIDLSPPTSTLTPAPAAPDGSNGWYTSIPSLTITSNEAGTSQYQWNSTADVSWTNYSGAFSGIENQNTLFYRSIDTSGNTEDPAASSTFKIDTVLPSNPSLSSPSHTTSDSSQDTTIDIDWSGESDGSSGVDGFSYSFSTTAVETPDTVKDAEESASSTTSASLGDGQQYFHFRTLDNAGNWSAAIHIGPFTIDNAEPNSAFSDPVDGQYMNGSDYTLSGTASDSLSSVVSVEVRVDGGAWNTAAGTTSWSYLWTFPGDGNYTIQSRATDSAGNVETSFPSVGVTVDNVAPTVSGNNPLDLATGVGTGTNITVTFNEDMSGDTFTTANFTLKDSTGDPVAGSVSYDNPTRTATFDPTSTLNSLTTYTAAVTTDVTDAAGNNMASDHSFSFTTADQTLSTTTATLTIAAADGNNGWYVTRPKVVIECTADCSGGTPEYQWDTTGGAWTNPAANPATIDALQGDHIFYFKSNDEIPNSLNIKVDDTSLGGTPTDPDPSSPSHVTGDTATTDNTIDMDWSGASDSDSGVAGFSISWTNGATDTPDQVLDHSSDIASDTSPPLANGTWYFHIRTSDNAGNWTSTEHEGPFEIQFIGAGPHGGFSSTTSKCANCHRPHSAPGYRLIFAREGSYSTIAGFCFTCHKDGAGANNDVYGGVFRGTFSGTQDASGATLDSSGQPLFFDLENTSNYGASNAGLNGGGFVSARPYDGLGNRTGATASVTSRHDVAGVPGVTQEAVTLWGSTTTGPGTSGFVLWCVSCHNPHGSSNYRLLRDSLTPQGGRTFPEDTVKSKEAAFDTNPATGNLAKSYTTTAYWQGIVRFCTSCHLQYGTAKGVLDPDDDSVSEDATYDSGDGFGAKVRYRHPVSVAISNWTWPGYDNWGQANGDIAANLNDPDHVKLPLEQDTYTTTIQSSDRIVCLTCHQVHGSSAAQVSLENRAGPTTTAASSAVAGGQGYSNLLRMDYRGICENCHDWWHDPTDQNSE